MKKIYIFSFIILILTQSQLNSRPTSNNIFDYKHQQTDVGVPLMDRIDNFENAFAPF